jgi:hypothetical protein
MSMPVDTTRYPRLTAARVPLSKQDIDVFYRHFAKEAFWPMLHTFWERARFREDHWQIFCRVNRAFAERTALEAAEGAVAWIHDYNLWMVPAYLRELRPDLKIAFFHHTYFPSADVFNVVPWRRAIIGSLLQSITSASIFRARSRTSLTWCAAPRRSRSLSGRAAPRASSPTAARSGWSTTPSRSRWATGASASARTRSARTSGASPKRSGVTM